MVKITGMRPKARKGDQKYYILIKGLFYNAKSKNYNYLRRIR